MSVRSKKNRRKALYVAKSGSVKVAVHSSRSTKTDGTVYPGYRLDYYDVNEKRHQPYYADFNDAKAAADTLARDLALGEHQNQTSGSSLSKEEVADYRRLQKLTTDLSDISLFDFLTRDAIPALLTLKACGFGSLGDSATHYCRDFRGKPSMNVADAIEIALAQKYPVWSPKTYQVHKAAWQKLSTSYGSKNIRDLDISDVADVLLRATGRVTTRAAAAAPSTVPAVSVGPLPLPVDESNQVSIQKGKEFPAQISRKKITKNPKKPNDVSVLAEKTYNNIRSRLVTFLLWTESPEGGLVPPRYFPTTALNILEEPECLKETCSAADLKKLFDVTTDQRDKSCLSLGKNAGVRSCEIARMKKKFICWDEKVLKLPGFDTDATRITKTGKSRSIPINSRLMRDLDWLRDPSIPPDFHICRVLDWSAKLTEIAAKADVVLPDNGLRHGYGTHRLKLTQNVGKVSIEMGNTVYTLLKHYAKDVNARESRAWFKV